jgi:uncharacterized protein (DUF433 family)
MAASELITQDREIMSGAPVFKGTRVPIKTLFDYIENGYTLQEFVACFPTVTLEMAKAVLEESMHAVLAEPG